MGLEELLPLRKATKKATRKRTFLTCCPTNECLIEALRLRKVITNYENKKFLDVINNNGKYFM